MKSVRFKIFLAVALTITLSAKLLNGGRVDNPSFDLVLSGAEKALVAQGYLSAGMTTFSGRKALLAGRGACFIYVVPVAHQGWHQETLRKGMAADQSLWFVFEGTLTAETQPEWRTLFGYYVQKSLRYAGFPATYHPVFGVVASRECNVSNVDWASLPAVPFRARTSGGNFSAL